MRIRHGTLLVIADLDVRKEGSLMSDPLVEALPALAWAGLTAAALCTGAVVLAGSLSFVAFVVSKVVHSVAGRRA